MGPLPPATIQCLTVLGPSERYYQPDPPPPDPPPPDPPLADPPLSDPPLSDPPLADPLLDVGLQPPTLSQPPPMVIATAASRMISLFFMASLLWEWCESPLNISSNRSGNVRC